VERLAPFEEMRHANLMSHVEVFIGTALTEAVDPDVADYEVIYTVADWIEGVSLADFATECDVRNLLLMACAVGEGLHELHRHRSASAPHGLVHRDVKPSNVLVTSDGVPVLIDFGVARPLDHGDLTRGVGTYRWRAPEVLSGSAPITAAVDAWGLGALGYWMLTGDPPGLEGAGTAREQILHAPRARELPDPAGTAQLISALLETDPRRRPDDLHRWSSRLAIILRRPARPPWKRRVTITAAAALIAPVAFLAARTANDTATPTSSEPGSASAGSTRSPRTSPGVDAGPGLVASTGDTWRVLCLGAAESVVVTGAPPGRDIPVALVYGEETPAAVRDEYFYPRSRVQAPPDWPNPRGIRSLKNSQAYITATATGSFVVEFHCDRGEIGVPLELHLPYPSASATVVRIVSRDEIENLTIDARTIDTSEEVGSSVTADAEIRVEIIPTLSAYAADQGGELTMKTSRDLDPRMTLTSSDPSVLAVKPNEAPDSGWLVSAIRPGAATLTASIPGTLHRVTRTVRIAG
jgi:hypothetical protein